MVPRGAAGSPLRRGRRLSDRERAVPGCLAEGGNADIARALRMSQNTVKFLRNLYTKLG
jgi:ATP/maltotriose-dependent transcriptional regulator MalT